MYRSLSYSMCASTILLVFFLCSEVVFYVLAVTHHSKKPLILLNFLASTLYENRVISKADGQLPVKFTQTKIPENLTIVRCTR